MTKVADLRPPRLGPPSSELTDRARDLLDQIESIIVQEGFRRLTVDSLASRLKCSKSTLYDLAPNREELVLVVLDRRWRRTGRQLQELLATLDDPSERLKAYLMADAHHPQRTSLQFSTDLARHPAAHRLFMDHLRHSLNLLEQIVQEGIDRGRFQPLPPGMVAEIVNAAGVRVADPELLRSLGMTYDDAVEVLFRIVWGGLTSKPLPAEPTGTRRTRRS